MLSDAIAAALPELRAEAEAAMTATCTIRARDGEWVTDEATGEATQTPGATVYSGRCRWKPAGRAAQAEMAGGAEVFGTDFIVSIPFAATAVRKGQLVTCDSSPDAALVGLVVEIQDVARGDQISARRLACVEVS
jgi:hypothetical protein